MSEPKYLKLESDRYTFTTKEEAQYAMITIEEYNGLRNALRIIHDRSMQQIRKSETDADGYKLLRCEERKYPYSERSAWYVRKLTPYSTSMPPGDVIFMVKDYLATMGAYDENLIDCRGIRFSDVDILEMCSLFREDPVEMSKLRIYFRDRDYRFRDGVDKTVAEWISNRDGCAVLRVVGVYPDYRSGLYEAAYWQTFMDEVRL